jgi:hypothetical protein
MDRQGEDRDATDKLWIDGDASERHNADPDASASPAVSVEKFSYQWHLGNS